MFVKPIMVQFSVKFRPAFYDNYVFVTFYSQYIVIHSHVVYHVTTKLSNVYN